jgi:D-glycero-alpha-D-manno-heptose-7-phosphate kinase
MIITRTPYRMSFFGGGTDYPAHFLKHGGSVLASSINKYCYISCRNLPPFFDHKYRIAYSQIETTETIENIKHPAVRGVLEYLKVSDGLEIQHHGDLPARSGLGSSSSFTAGLLHSLHALEGRMISKYDLAMQTIDVEQNIIGEKVGSQDQIMASIGGLNCINFSQDGTITVKPVIISKDKKDWLNDHLLMFFSGVSRNSQDITAQKIKCIKSKASEMKHLGGLVEQSLSIINSSTCISEFGKLLHEAWLLKRSISQNISTNLIDSIYETARENGALGGKLMGAGGGGFMVFFASPNKHVRIKKALSKLVHVPFRFENNGSTVCMYEPNGL